MNKVETLDIAALRIPLVKPVRLGAVTIAQRDYVALRLTLSDGAEGFAYGYDRGLPLFDVCAKAAQTYMGQDADDRARLRKLALGPTPAPHATMTRGMSLCDIALWDAWCKSHLVALWQALGAVRRQAPVMAVFGYGITAENAGREAAALAAQGYRAIKCMIDGRDFKSDQRVMEAVAEALPDSTHFGIDAHWSWTSVAEALPWCRLAERLGARFVEDPFAPTCVHAVAELASRVDVPLAVGEDVIDIFGFRDLATLGGIVRIDASVSGGVSGTLEAIGLARAFNRPVIPHVLPSLHANFAFACEGVSCIEMITREVGADPIDAFFKTPLLIEDGYAIARETPGTGQELDWEKLGPYVMRTETFRQ
ncbi:mandelate racemase/muconate lactonizing enzyme family protein [Paraburkholderia youngii]|uniref:mandelate racemase/muconate lactonizing enzyme family protein n=1 Tax=Paraburkholderia youngii TaxID=2782701 RepID=UPI003D1A94D9